MIVFFVLSFYDLVMEVWSKMKCIKDTLPAE